ARPRQSSTKRAASAGRAGGGGDMESGDRGCGESTKRASGLHAVPAVVPAADPPGRKLNPGGLRVNVQALRAARRFRKGTGYVLRRGACAYHSTPMTASP